MGLIPATGSEVSLGRIGQALGLGTAGTVQVALNAGAGANRANNSSGVGNIAGGTQTDESASFGGLEANGTY